MSKDYSWTTPEHRAFLQALDVTIEKRRQFWRLHSHRAKAMVQALRAKRPDLAGQSFGDLCCLIADNNGEL